MDAWLAGRWPVLLARLGARGSGRGVLEVLDRGYGSRARAYHTWGHVRRCLEELDEVAAPDGDTDAGAAEAALWFHDAVYEPRRADNELQSGALARRSLAQLGLRAELASRVELLVLATDHGAPPPEPRSAAALVRDIDLAILSAAAPEFDAYDRAIRLEYAHLGEEEYRAGRSSVLAGLLARPRIYVTERFHPDREARARTNIRRAIEGLARAAGPAVGSKPD